MFADVSSNSNMNDIIELTFFISLFFLYSSDMSMLYDDITGRLFEEKMTSMNSKNLADRTDSIKKEYSNSHAF